jgi:DNA-binding response OmpR family regulator
MESMLVEAPRKIQCRRGVCLFTRREYFFRRVYVCSRRVNKDSHGVSVCSGEIGDTCVKQSWRAPHVPSRDHRRRPPTSHQLKQWILSAKPGITVEQWFSRDDAEAAIAREDYDLVVLDIELGRERHAGVAIINAINKSARGTPVLVVSAMPATIYRSIMKALDAWDYLQKTTFSEADFVDTFLEILRTARDRSPGKPCLPVGEELSLDPLRQGAPRWRGQRVNLPLTAQRILATLYEKRGQVVSYDELFQVVKSGRNRDNIRKHISTIRDAFRELDEAFDGIENIPMRGFRWSDPARRQ